MQLLVQIEIAIGSQTYLAMKSSLRNTTAVIIEKNGQVSMLLFKVKKGFTYEKFKCTAKK